MSHTTTEATLVELQTTLHNYIMLTDFIYTQLSTLMPVLKKLMRQGELDAATAALDAEHERQVNGTKANEQNEIAIQ